MSTIASFGSSSAPTTSYYPLESPFSFSYGQESQDFSSAFSPNMNRYLKSPTPSGSGRELGENGTSRQPHHTPPSNIHSPNAYDMGNLSLQSPTGPPTQPIPISTPGTLNVSPNGYSYGSSSSLPHRHGNHQTYHPYARPSDGQSQYLFRSPPGSSHSANSGPLSSALVSPMSDTADMSPLPISYYGHNHPHYIASPLNGHDGMSPISPLAQQPRYMASDTGMTNGSGLGLGLDFAMGFGTGGMHFASNGQMLGGGQIPQYPPGNAGNGRARGRGRGGGGGGTKRKNSGDRQNGIGGTGSVRPRVKKEDEGMERDDEDEDEDAEGDSLPGDGVSGTHKSQLEKRRRMVLKQHFAALASELEPAPSVNKGSYKGATKVNTLERAAIKIRDLRMSVNALSDEKQALSDALMDERLAHIETQRLNAELSRALAAIRTGSNGCERIGSPPA